ncbi:MAG: hypothetical protein IME98_04485, partial [Proteobacteria bacterium]|nr:hypothetical protein [Pseudomonadota bacterium]
MSTDDNDFGNITEEDLPAAPSTEPINTPPAASEPSKPPARTKLSGIGTLFGKTWRVFKARVWTLLLIMLLTILLTFIGAGIAFIPTFISPTLAFISILLVCIIIFSVMARCYVALYYAIPRDCGVIDSFKETKGRALPFLWIMLLQGSVIMGGYMLLVIPGIILTVLLLFPLFIFIEEDERGMNSLLKSMAYVKGHGISVFLRLIALFIVLFIISIILAFIPIVGPIISFVLTPFTLVYIFLIYNELREIKGEFNFQPSKKLKLGLILISIIGPLVPIAIAAAMIGSMGLAMLPMMMSQMTGMQQGMTIQMQQNNGNTSTTTKLNITNKPLQI